MPQTSQNNASVDEAVGQNVRQRGEFNILQGNTLLPNNLNTAQGSNGIDTPEGTTFDNLSEPVNPHGVLVRNTNIASLYPSTSAATEIPQSTVSGVDISSSLSFANIAITFASYSGSFAQTLPAANGSISNVVVNNVYSGSTTSTAKFSGSSVHTSGAGWSQNGNTLVWTNGIFPAFSGASSANGSRAIPFSGQTYYLDISYNDVLEGSIVTGAVGVLDLSASLKQVRVGMDNFGTSLDGTSQVVVTGSTRSDISMPTNQSLASDNFIPNVGSRFFR